MSGTLAVAAPKRLTARPAISDEHRMSVEQLISDVQNGGMQMPVVVDEFGVAVPAIPVPRRSVAREAYYLFREEFNRRIDAVKSRQLAIAEEKAAHATILAIVPAHNEERDIVTAIVSLLKQTRQIDLIVVMVNNSTDATAELLKPFVELSQQQNLEGKPFPRLIVEVEDNMQNGKVGALNYVWQKYARQNRFDFVLGVDADVECDLEMVKHLEAELIHKTKAAGIMARYSFKIPGDLKRKQKRWIMNQRQEFGMTGIRQQLRGGRSDILGGQATLFRSEALIAAAKETDGGCPWNPDSAVEDAELTRTFQRLRDPNGGPRYTTAVSTDARAWVGPMLNAHSWHKQRMKWEGGHLSDMLKDFHPWADRRRWLEQAGLGWNLLLRVLFVALLATSLSQHKFVWHYYWLVPVAMAAFQSFLVACKLPNRRFGEIFRAILFVPGEIYLWRSLAVWVGSVLKTAADIRGNLWQAQYNAEAANKTRSVSAWMTIILTITVPVACLNLLAGFISGPHMDVVLTDLWRILTAMTAFSVLWMVVWTLRILRRFRSLHP